MFLRSFSSLLLILILAGCGDPSFFAATHDRSSSSPTPTPDENQNNSNEDPDADADSEDPVDVTIPPEEEDPDAPNFAPSGSDRAPAPWTLILSDDDLTYFTDLETELATVQPDWPRFDQLEVGSILFAEEEEQNLIRKVNAIDDEDSQTRLHLSTALYTHAFLPVED